MPRTTLSRRRFLQSTAGGLSAMLLTGGCASLDRSESKATCPNVVFVFADQWRACDTGYAGNTQVRTPHLDRLAGESLNFTTAVSGCPVCGPYRASLLTGQYWLTHGVFYNDKPLDPDAVTIAKVYEAAGYDTAYIGKWHVNGHGSGETTADGRNRPVPEGRRQGFDFWKVSECTHDYNDSIYFDEKDIKHTWEGYDTIAQTRLAQRYISDHSRGRPFVLFLSWGPPHAPYQTAPERYRQQFDPDEIIVRANVPQDLASRARKEIAGYYAHMAALDDCIGDLLGTLDDIGIAQDTIFVFTSDHGDMLHSHGMTKKQKPWDESIRVPLLLRYPAVHGTRGRVIDTPINTPDLMPTLLGLSAIGIPDSVEGKDFSGLINGQETGEIEAALIALPVPFHQWSYERGGREYRGVRTRRYTYVRDLNGPWLLYDNRTDPCQLENLAGRPEHARLRRRLDALLKERLESTNDEFLPGPDYMKTWGYGWDGSDTPGQSLPHSASASS